LSSSPWLIAFTAWELLASDRTIDAAVRTHGQAPGSVVFYPLILVPVILGLRGAERRIGARSSSRWSIDARWHDDRAAWFAVPLLAVAAGFVQPLAQAVTHASTPLPEPILGRPTTYMVAYFVAAAVMAPVAEELLFRGLLLGWLLRHWSAWLAVVATSALFAAAHILFMHYRADGLASTFLSGMVLGWLRVSTGRVFPGMVLHATFNGLIIALADLGDVGNAAGFAVVVFLALTGLLSAVRSLPQKGRLAPGTPTVYGDGGPARGHR